MKPGRGKIAPLVFAGVLALAGAGAQAAEIFPKPEKSRLEVAIAAWGPTTLPLLVAQEAGYFARHGVTVSITQVSASAAVQGVVSGAIDIYQGGAAAIAATLAGASIIYVAAGVDRSSLVLFGQKGLTAFEMLRGKAVATTSPGAFGEIAMRMTARKYGMEIGRDIKLLYHRSVQEALGTFLVGNADGLIITPPATETARKQGYPVIVDYYKDGLKIVGPGTAVTREFAQKNPNTLKAYLRACLDGVKRALDDEEFAKKADAKYEKISDPQVLSENYQQGARVWNKDMTIDPAAIRLVLDDSSDPKAKSADPKTFYDNSIIEAVNREYAVKLFPGAITSPGGAK
ncbi:MAG TPA: ABC transporter substrate-binding protein [Candidatus Binatia bacterium]|jgi:ABC-type nitrate/sulfonate/bicarbonate transport system substrate-binding protein